MLLLLLWWRRREEGGRRGRPDVGSVDCHCFKDNVAPYAFYCFFAWLIAWCPTCCVYLGSTLLPSTRPPLPWVMTDSPTFWVVFPVILFIFLETRSKQGEQTNTHNLHPSSTAFLGVEVQIWTLTTCLPLPMLLPTMTLSV